MKALIILLPISLIVPLAAGTLAVVQGFDGLYGQDAYAYYDYGTVALREQMYPPPPFFWPPGYPLVILVFSSLMGSTPLAAQLVSLAAGGLVVLATGLITYETTQHKGAAVLAALVMALVGQLWQSSAVIMADTLSLAAVTMGVWSLTRYARLLQSRANGLFWLVLAAGWVAYGTITRWGYGIVALVCFVYALVLFWRHRSTAIRHGFFAAVVALMILVPVLLPSFTDGNTYGGNFQLQFKTWSLSHAFSSDFVNSDGQFNFEQWNALYYADLLTEPFYFTSILALFVIPGLLSRESRRLALLPVMGWLLAMYVLLIGLPQQNVRFALSFSPPIAIFSGIGVVTVWHWLRQNHILRGALVVIVGWGILWALVGATQYTRQFIARQQQDKATVQWVSDHVPDDAQIIVFGLTLAVDHYTPIETHEIYYLDEAALAEVINADKHTYLLLDRHNVETQWRGRSPYENYHHLRDDPGLTEIGKHRAFTLYAVIR